MMVVVVAVMNLSLGSRDCLKGRVEVCVWNLVDKLVGGPCCTAKPVSVVAAGLDSSY